MKTLLVSGLATVGLLGTGVTGVALVATPADEVPPSHVELPEQARVPDDRAGDGVPAKPDRIRERGTPASEQGRARRAAAMAFVTSKKEWTACVADAAPAHDETPGDFDPEAACGDKPVPSAAEEARDRGSDSRPDGAGKPDGAGSQGAGPS